MKKLVIITIVLLNVAGLVGIPYPVSANGGSVVFKASKQATVDPSTADQTKGADAQAQDDQSSTGAKQDVENKKTVNAGILQGKEFPNARVSSMSRSAQFTITSQQTITEEARNASQAEETQDDQRSTDNITAGQNSKNKKNGH